jgi:hypothetical protein
MFATEESWEEGDDNNAESGIVNNPLLEKTPSKVQWHAILGLSDTPSSSLFGATSTPASTGVDTSRHSISASAPVHHDAMSTTDRPRLPEASLTPKAFGGSTAEIDNAERWLRYLNQYVQYRHLRDDEALTLFKLLLTDQAQDWLFCVTGGPGRFLSQAARGLYDSLHAKSAPEVSESVEHVVKDAAGQRII